MNERIKELYTQVCMEQKLPFTVEHNSAVMLDAFANKFAELIVQECISINRQRMFSDYEGDSLRVAHNNALLCANSDMFEHFGVEECRGWVCPKCGVDRTKDVCPQGHMAAVEGKCPMIGVAQ